MCAVLTMERWPEQQSRHSLTNLFAARAKESYIKHTPNVVPARAP